jgi:protocatechuate 3,4-dioxygenase beta subunit
LKEAFDRPPQAGSRIVLGPTPGLTQARTATHPIRLVVFGLVQDSECKPLAGARLGINNANPDGWYGPNGSDSCCYYEGALTTDPDGRFAFETVKPGHYHDVVPPPPAHVHVKVDYSGMPGVRFELQFLGDPSLTSPPLKTAVELISDSDAQGSFLRASLMITLSTM